MTTFLTPLRNKFPPGEQYASIAIVIIILFIFYTPWLFEGGRIVEVHDNLDGEIVHNYIIGQFFGGNYEATKLALNGEVPFFTLSRVTQPLTFLYVILDAWKAYAVTDLVVRIIAFCGIYLLARHFLLSPLLATLLSLQFSVSISHTAFLFTVSGLPLLLYLFVLTSKSSKLGLLIPLLIFFVSSNISITLSGIFFAICLPFFFFGLSLRLDKKLALAFLFFCLGLIFGNSGLILSYPFNDQVFHRTEWPAFRPYLPFFLTFLDTLRGLISSTTGDHVSLNLAPLILLFLVLLLSRGFRTRAPVFFILLICIYAFETFIATGASNFVRELVPFLRYFQVQRFYFLYSVLIFLGVIVSLKGYSKNSLVLYFAILVGIVFNLMQTPHLKEPLRLLAGKKPMESFNEYYKRADYGNIKAIVGDSPVLSVSIDPMVAPMNGIRSIDGYYSLYPLEYKRRFRLVIAEGLKVSGREKYYDEWGSRVYTFYEPGPPDVIDFCEAERIGARYVISTKTLTNSVVLKHVEFAGSGTTMLLYKIIPGSCVTGLGQR